MLTYQASPVRTSTNFLPAEWSGGAARTTRCKLKAAYRVTAKQRPTYDRLAALCGLHGKVARIDAMAELDPAAQPAQPPVAFSVLGADQWVLFADEAMTQEVTLTHAEVAALVGLDAAKPKATPKPKAQVTPAPVSEPTPAGLKAARRVANLLDQDADGANVACTWGNVRAGDDGETFAFDLTGIPKAAAIRITATLAALAA